MRYEVRCCCDPSKLLGYLDIERQPGQVMIPIPAVHERPNLCPSSEPLRAVTHEAVTLAFAEYNPWPGAAYLAVKSNDVPLERLKLIPSFIPATGGEDSNAPQSYEVVRCEE